MRHLEHCDIAQVRGCDERITARVYVQENDGHRLIRIRARTVTPIQRGRNFLRRRAVFEGREIGDRIVRRGHKFNGPFRLFAELFVARFLIKRIRFALFALRKRRLFSRCRCGCLCRCLRTLSLRARADIARIRLDRSEVTVGVDTSPRRTLRRRQQQKIQHCRCATRSANGVSDNASRKWYLKTTCV